MTAGKIGNRDFQLDLDAKSFRLMGFRMVHARVLLFVSMLSLCLLSTINLTVGFDAALLSHDAWLFMFGLTLGYVAGVLIGIRRAEAPALQPAATSSQVIPLSDRVKTIADDPHRKLEAVKLYLEESGASLVQAKVAVETYINRDPALRN